MGEYKPSYMDFSWLSQLPDLAKGAEEDRMIKAAFGKGINWDDPKQIEKIANVLGTIGTDKSLKLSMGLGEMANKRREALQTEATSKAISGWATGQPIGGGAPMGAPGPSQYDDIVRAAAQKYNIPVADALRQRQVESGNRPSPTITSSAGAVGPMQIMPDTARRIGVQNITDPAENIDKGLGLQAQLIQKYGGNKGLGYAAYHAGEPNVNKFLAGQPSGVGPKTRNYVQAITGHSLEEWVAASKDPAQGDILEAKDAAREYKQQSERPSRREAEAQALASMPGMKNLPGAKDMALQAAKLEGERRNEELKADSKAFREFEADTYKRRETSDRLIPLLSKASTLIENPAALQGTGAETAGKLGSFVGTMVQLGKQFGVDVSGFAPIMKIADVTARTQELDRLTKKVVLEILENKLGGQVSNTDRDFVAQAQIALANSPDANRLLAKLALKMAQKDRETAAIVAAYEKEGGRSRAGLEQVLAKHKARDVITEADKAEIAAAAARAGGGGGGPQPPPAPSGPQAPKIGEFRYGRPYKGGDPADPASWGDRAAPGGI